MPWIESHTVLIRHRKVLQLAEALNLDAVTTVGHLHVFWHAVLEQQEDGDLSDWSDAMIARAALFSGDASLFVRELQAKKWLDGKLVHDWLDYTGRYLTNKYRTANHKKLKEIFRLHGVRLKSDYSRTKVRLKSDNQPNQPNITKPITTRAAQLAALEAFTVTEEMCAWAHTEFGIEIPDDSVTEFKEYWRQQKHLRDDWTATFRSRIRQLVGWKQLQPVKATAVLPEKKCAWKNGGGCEAYALAPSAYCLDHKVKIVKAQENMARKTNEVPAGTSAFAPISEIVGNISKKFEVPA